MNEQAQAANGASALAVASIEQGADQISPFSGSIAFESAQRMAKALASSDLMPQAYRNNIPNVLIAMELANRIGASVMMVAQNLDIIHGRPGWRSQFLIACVNSSKRFTPLRFRWQGTPGKMDWGCRAVAKDLKDNEECVGALITMQTAQDEGWSTKNGSKWKTLGEQMLMYRSAAFWTRVYAPELSLGMQTSEEIADVHGAATAGAMGSLPDDMMPKPAESLAATLGLEPSKPADAVIDADMDDDGVVSEEAKPATEPKAAPTQQTLDTGKVKPR